MFLISKKLNRALFLVKKVNLINNLLLSTNKNGLGPKKTKVHYLGNINFRKQNPPKKQEAIVTPIYQSKKQNSEPVKLINENLSKKENNNEEFSDEQSSEENWLTNISMDTIDLNSDFKISSFIRITENEFKNFNKEEKNKFLKILLKDLNLNYKEIDPGTVEKYWDQFEFCDNFRNIESLIKYMYIKSSSVKKAELFKEKMLQEFEKRTKDLQTRTELLKDTNIPVENVLYTKYLEESGYIETDSYFRNEERKFYKIRYVNKLVNDYQNIPPLVFDFRYLNDAVITKPHLVTILKQFQLIINDNFKTNNPFKICYCCFDKKRNKFHEFLGPYAKYDQELVFETEKSYMDLFPRKKLVYLSRDAHEVMEEYDPTKIYIIGSNRDSNDKYKYASLIQSKKDGIRCQKLPLEKYIKWKRGTKNFNMYLMYKIMNSLNSGASMKDSLLNSLPSRYFKD